MWHRLVQAVCVGAVLVLLVAGTPAARGDRGDSSPPGKGKAPLRARLRILVPADAFVFVARDRMASTGGVRVYESPPLERGRRYAYEISVLHEWR
jgi:hypothetical protein